MFIPTHGALSKRTKVIIFLLASVPVPELSQFLHIIFFFFYSVLRPFQDNFSSYETGQSVGGVKTGEPREKNT